MGSWNRLPNQAQAMMQEKSAKVEANLRRSRQVIMCMGAHTDGKYSYMLAVMPMEDCRGGCARNAHVTSEMNAEGWCEGGKGGGGGGGGGFRDTCREGMRRHEFGTTRKWQGGAPFKSQSTRSSCRRWARRPVSIKFKAPRPSPFQAMSGCPPKLAVSHRFD